MGPDKFQNITTILFDLDNTLINSKAADQIACEKVFQYLLTDGVRRSVARDAVDNFLDSLSHSSPHSDPLLHQWLRALGPARAPKAPKAAALWKKTRARNLRPHPDLEDLLLGLRGRYKLGLVHAGTRAEIEATGLASFFDALVVGGEGGGRREMFEEAFRRLDVVGMECALVCSSGFAAAAKARCGVTVCVQEEGTTPGRDEDDEGPDFVIREVGQLPDLLPERRRGFSSMCQDRRLGFFHSLREEGWTSSVV